MAEDRPVANHLTGATNGAAKASGLPQPQSLAVESLELFREQSSELRTVDAIAQLSEADFVASYAPFFGDARKARRAYRAALARRTQNALLWANVADAVAAPLAPEALVNSIPPSFIEQLLKTPGYDQLFAKLDVVDADDCRSIFGPAAYFVDLLRFIEKHIPQSGLPAGHSLAERQPRLYRTVLDCANTNDLVPYIDLVIEVLEDILRASADDPYAAVEQAAYPVQLPVHLPLEEIRIYLRQMRTSLQEIYRLFGAVPPEIAREILALSPREYGSIAAPLAAADLAKHYGGLDLDARGPGKIDDAQVFTERLGLTRAELNDLLFLDLSAAELTTGLARLLFINSTGEGLPHIAIDEALRSDGQAYERLVNLSIARLDRIYRFVKLSRKLGWSFADLDWAIRGLGGRAPVERALRFDGANDAVEVSRAGDLDDTSFTLEAWVMVERPGTHPIIWKGIPSAGFTQYLLWIMPDGRIALHGNLTAADHDFVRSANPSGPQGTKLASQDYYGISLASDGRIATGVFNHVAVSVNQAEDGYQRLRFYINGALDSTWSLKDGLAVALLPPGGDASSVAIAIGHDPERPANYFCGSIKEVRLWGAIRDAAAIGAQMLSRFTGREADLLAYWPLIESPTGTLSDLAVAFGAKARPAAPHPGSMGEGPLSDRPTWIDCDLALDPLPEPIAPFGFQFNGRDTYLGAQEVRGLALPAQDPELTIEAWVALDADADGCLIWHGDAATGATNYQLGVAAGGRLVFQLGGQSYGWDAGIALTKPAHVAVALDAQGVRFVVQQDGAQREHTDSTGPAATSSHGADLYVGRNQTAGTDQNLGQNPAGGAAYLAGALRELRIWNLARTAEQIAGARDFQLFGGEPGLAGYWRLDELRPQSDPAQPAADRSFNRNDLFPGGMLQTYQPTASSHAEYILPQPVRATAKALRLTPGSAPLLLTNDHDWGLGRDEQFTLQLWFKPGDTSRKQLLFAQGDAEIGFSIYLDAGKLRCYAWRVDFASGALLRDVPDLALDLAGTGWHHWSFVYDETALGEGAQYRLYLDGAEQIATGFRLNQSGGAGLGGLAAGMATRFHDQSTPADQAVFAGELADLRIWRRALAADLLTRPGDQFHARHVAPQPGDDLICCLPLDDGFGWPIGEHSGPRYDTGLDAQVAKVFDPDAARRTTRFAPPTDPALTWIYDQSANFADGVLLAGPDAPAPKWHDAALPISAYVEPGPWLAALGPSAMRAMLETGTDAPGSAEFAADPMPIDDRAALALDGVDDSALLRYYRIGDAGTVALRLRFLREFDQILFDASGDGDQGRRFVLDVRGQQLRFRLQSAGGAMFEAAPIDLAALPARFNIEFHDLAVSWDFGAAAVPGAGGAAGTPARPATARIFLDGQAGADSTLVPAAVGRPLLRGLSIGKNRGATPNAEIAGPPLEGKLLRVAIWQRAFAAADALPWRNDALTGAEPGLWILLLLDEGQGTKLHNRATQNATLVLASGATPTTRWLASGPAVQPGAALRLNPPSQPPVASQTATSDYIDLPYEIASEGTIDFWFQARRDVDQVIFDASNDFADNWPAGVSKNDEAAKKMFICQIRGNSLSLKVEDAGDADYMVSATLPTSAAGATPAWLHAAVTWRYGGSTVQLSLQVDTMEAVTTNKPTEKGNGKDRKAGLLGQMPAFKNLQFGRNRGNYKIIQNSPFQGALSQLRIWERAIDAGALRSLGTAQPQPGDVGLPFFFALDEGQGIALRNQALDGELLVGADSAPTRQWAKPGSGRVLSIDTSYLVLPPTADLRLDDGYTLETWLKLPDISTIHPLIGTHGPKVGQAAEELALGVKDGHPFVWVQGRELLADDLSLRPNTWHHVAWCSDAASGALTMLLDGAPSGRPFTIAAFKAPARRLLAGIWRHWDATARQWVEYRLAGHVDQIRLWDGARARLDLLRQLLRRLERGDQAGLLAGWDFSTGDPIADPPAPAPVLPARPTPALDGYNDYLDLGDTLFPAVPAGAAEAWTLELWLRHDPAKPRPIALDPPDEDGPQVVFSRAGHYRALLDGPNLRFEWGTGNQGQALAANLPAGEWQHLALAYDGSRLALFVSGAPVGAPVAVGQLPASDGVLTLGADSTALQGQFFRGALAEVRLWSVARSAEQIAANAARRLSGRERGLESAWALDGTISADGLPARPDPDARDADAGRLSAEGDRTLPPARFVTGLENTLDKWDATPPPLLADERPKQRHAPPPPDPVSALILDGRDDYVVLPPADALGLNGSFTVEALLLVEPQAPGQAVAVLGSADGLCLGLKDNRLYMRFGDGNEFLSAVEVGTGWRHLTWQYNLARQNAAGDTIASKLMLVSARARADVATNGSAPHGAVVMVGAQEQQDRARFVGTDQLFVGRWGSDGTAYLKGRVAEVRVWRGVRSAAELDAAAFVRLDGSEPDLASLAGYWIFDHVEQATYPSRAAVPPRAADQNGYWLTARAIGRPAQPRWAIASDYPILANPLGRQAFAFDGRRQYLAAQAVVLGTQGFAIEAWVRSHPGPNPVVWLGSIGGAAPATWAELRVNDAGQLELILPGTAASPLRSVGKLPDGQFAHVAASFGLERGKTTAHLFVNGQPAGDASFDGGLPTEALVLLVGRSERDGTLFAGEIQELRLWSGARGAGDLAAQMYHPLDASQLPNLIGYWPLAEVLDQGGLPAAGGATDPQRLLFTPDRSGNGLALRLGGLPFSRKPAAARDGDAPFLDALRPVLTLGEPLPGLLRPSAPADTVMLSMPVLRAPQPMALDPKPLHRSQRTVEVWFLCDDIFAPGRQIVYEEGDASRGLGIYVEGGQLRFEGRDTAAGESGWVGSAVVTGRIESGRWHHAALVLDGRASLHDDSFAAFLDAHPLDVQPGSRLWGVGAPISVGGLRFTPAPAVGALPSAPGKLADWQYQTVAVAVDGQHLRGQIREVRVWDAARGPAQLAAAMYDFPGDDDLARLALYLDTRRLAADLLDLLVVPDGAPDGFASSPRIPLADLAALSELRDRLALSVEQLTALWSDIKHVGAGDGRTLYDELFNPPRTAPADLWPYWLGQTRVWDLTSSDEAQRRVRSRLMAALRVSHSELDAMLEAIDGGLPERVVLDSGYLTQLYRLRLLATALRLPVTDAGRLIVQLQQETTNSAHPLAKLSALALADVRAVLERAAWLRDAGITLDEYSYLTHGAAADPTALPFKPAQAVAAATSLLNQAAPYLLTPTSLADLLDGSETAARAVYDELVVTGARELARAAAPSAVITPDFKGFYNLTLVARALNWEVSFDDLVIAKAALIEAKLIDANGLVVATDPASYSVDALAKLYLAQPPAEEEPAGAADGAAGPPDPVPAAAASPTDKIQLLGSLIASRATAQVQIPAAITERLATSRSELSTTIVTTLAALLHADADLLLAVMAAYTPAPETTAQFVDRMLFQLDGRALDVAEFLDELADIAAAGDLAAGPDVAEYLGRLSKTLVLLEQFDLSLDESGLLLEHPDAFGLRPSSLINPTWDDLNRLYLFGRLKNALEDDAGQLAAGLVAGAEGAFAALGRLAGASRETLRRLARGLGVGDPTRDLVDLDKIQRGLGLAEALGTDADYLIALAGTSADSSPAAPGAADPRFAVFKRHSAALFDLLRAQSDDAQWPEVYRPIHAALSILRRDSLTAVALEQLAKLLGDRKRPDVLYEYLLIDVQIGSETDTSRIVQGLASLQLYVERCLMNLEAGVDPAKLGQLAQEWRWMKNYRVWEANRKVFLYPENYIEPELRDTKTELFRALEEELQQADVNPESAELAFTHYLDKFAEVANLNIIGSYLYVDPKNLPTGTTYALRFEGQGSIQISTAPEAAQVLPTAALTIELWMRHEHMDSIGGLLAIYDARKDQPQKGWSLSVENGAVRFSFMDKNSSAFKSIMSSTQAPVDRWTHVAVSYSYDAAARSGKVVMYLNGVEVASTPVAGELVYSDDPAAAGFLLGVRDDLNLPAKFLRGELREVRIWTRARTSAQIQGAMLGGPSPDDTGLLRYWKMDDGPGEDKTAAGFNKTIADHGRAATQAPLTIPAAQGIRWAETEPLVPALAAAIEVVRFDGQSGLAVADVAAIKTALQQAFTLELWVRHEHADSLGGLLGACTLNGSAPELGWGLSVNSGRFELTVATTASGGTNAQTISTPEISPALAWAHVAASYDGAKIRLFVDGAEVASDDLSGAIAYPADTQPLILGAWQDQSTNPFRGAIRDVRIWSVARTAQQIQANMAGPIPADTPSLLHAWSLDHGAHLLWDSNMIADYGAGNIPLNIAGRAWADVEPYLPARPTDAATAFTLYLVGRNAKTGELYTRTLESDLGWQPWEKIELTLSAAYVTPIFAFGRLYLFWSEFEEIVKSELRRVAEVDKNGHPYDQAGIAIEVNDTSDPIRLLGGDTQKIGALVFSNPPSGESTAKIINVPYYKPRVKYTVHNFSGAWTQPQVLLPSDNAWSTELTHWERRKPQWQRVYVQRALKSSRESLPSAEEQLTNVSAYRLVKDTRLSKTLPRFVMNQWSIGLLAYAKPLRPPADKYYQRYARPDADPITLLRYGAQQQLYVGLSSRTKEIAGAHAESNVARDARAAADAAQKAVTSIQTKMARRDAALSDPAACNQAATTVQASANPDLARQPDQGSTPTLTKPSGNHRNLAAAIAASANDAASAIDAARAAFALPPNVADTADDAAKRDFANQWAALAERVADSAARADEGDKFGAAAAAEGAARVLGSAQTNAAAARAAATTARTAASSARAYANQTGDALDAAVKADQQAADDEQAAAEEAAKQPPAIPDAARIQQLKDAAEAQRQLARDKRTEATSAANNARTQGEAAINLAVTAAREASAALTALETDTNTKPLWLADGYDLSVSISTAQQKPAPVRSAIPGDAWRQIVLTMRYLDGNYHVQPYIEGVPIGPQLTYGVDLFVPNQSLDILPPDVTPAPDSTATEIWVSSLEVWSSLRNPATMKQDTRVRRLGFEAGLFYLPLDGNGDESSAAIGTPPQQLDLVRRLPPIAMLSKHERILVIYGEGIVRSLRGNVEDRGWAPSLDNPNVGIPNFGIHLQPVFGGAANLTRDEEARGGAFEYYPNTKPAAIPASSSVFEGFTLDRYAIDDKKEAVEKSSVPNHPLKAVVADRERGCLFQTLLTGLTYNDSQILDVDGQPGWFIFDVGAEQFLVTMDINGRRIMTAEERLRFDYPLDSVPGESDTQPVTVSFAPDFALHMDAARRPNYFFDRMNTAAINTLSEILFVEGVDGLLSLKAQATNEPDFAEFLPNQDDPSAYRRVIAPRGRLPGQQVDNRLDFDGAYGMYYREIFFHIPFLIANQLNANQHFDEARRWYHYIFNPTTDEAATSDAPATNGQPPSGPAVRYWRYRPFREQPDTPERLADMLTNERALQRYYDDPFDPHAIAELRMSAYQKAVVMKYIDNLLDWADSLFRQDTRESINEAMPLYVLSATLLGPRPAGRQPRRYDPIGDYRNVLANHRSGVPDFLTRLDGSHPAPLAADKPDFKVPFNPNIVLDTTFAVVPNQQFLGYWDRVGDRLFKIRHSLNIDGIFRSLDLFQPPIDPAALVRAVASLGAGGLGGAVAALNATVPHYRFDVVLDRAKDLTSTAIGLGGALLGALEKQDAEELTLLQNSQEARLLDLQTAMKQQQKQIADLGLESLQQSLESARHRYEYYKELFNVNLIPLEIASLTFLTVSKVAKGVSAVLKGIAGGASAAPQITVGGAGVFGSPVSTVTVGGDQIEGPIEKASEVLEIGGDIAGDIGELLGKGAEWERRREEWGFNRDLAEFDVKQLELQLESAKLQVKLAERDLEVHLETIQQNREVGEFYRRKFSNRDLYNWMASRLSALYFQTYRMAYDLAKQAERAYQFEFGATDTYITFGGWDSRRKGLLAGEALLLDLQRLDQAAMAQNSRYFEIDKTISLARLDPLALLQFKQTGSCQFSLGERIFDQDYPGHYFRIIKSVAISIPAVVGPYQSVHATLTQTSHKTLLTPDSAGVEYLMGLREDAPAGAIRADWRARQQIALSRGVEDSGVFELDFNDERYLPFENTGAVSTWLLEMPLATNPIDFDTISDVVIHLKYMTKTDSSLRDVVVAMDAIKTYRGSRLFSLADEFVAQWHAYKNGAELVLPLPPSTLPPNLGGDYTVEVAEIRGIDATGTVDRKPITRKFAPEYDPDTRSIRLNPSKLPGTVANLLVLVNIEGTLRGLG